MLWDIVVIRDGYLIYIDMNERIINIVKNLDIYEVNKLLGWNFYGIYSVLFGDFLVIMGSDDYKYIKVVCFFVNEEKNI